jgi:nucleoid-associated protein YgaU
MRDMTANALANIGRLRPGTAQPQPQPEKLQALIAQALKQGQSDSYIDALLNEAASRGEVAVPKALVTPEGRVDTATLLANIVASATAAAQGQTPVDMAKGQPVGGKGVEIRMVTQADGTSVQYQFYTVGVGDSLGAIAVKFYGDVAKFNTIFEANRTILSSPDKIRVGQRLVIPRA